MEEKKLESAQKLMLPSELDDFQILSIHGRCEQMMSKLQLISSPKAVQ
jgi:hypothetical protein